MTTLSVINRVLRFPRLAGIWLAGLLLLVTVQVMVAQTGVTEERVPGQADDVEADTVEITTTQETPTTAETIPTPVIVGGNSLYLPVLAKSIPPVLTLYVSRPNSFNQWTAFWTDAGSGVIYELQESQDPAFGTATPYMIDSAASYLLGHTPSPYNVYYYRVRLIAGSHTGEWSNIVRVIGGYHDDFDDPNSGWALRRTTYIEQVRSFYEPGIYVIQIDDSWDWGLASPGALAPEVPYVIEYMSEPAHLGNLISHGMVFGGDWPGDICPDWSTLEGVYAHHLCFNHFYNSNIIWFGDQDLKLLWERVDELIWCPSCGGSPMKRLGDIEPDRTINLHAGNASEWNTYRIEVRENDIRFYFNNHLEHGYADTRWVHEPYFGVFASTDEYSNSTWRFDYVSVMPLDE